VAEIIILYLKQEKNWICSETCIVFPYNSLETIKGYIKMRKIKLEKPQSNLLHMKVQIFVSVKKKILKKWARAGRMAQLVEHLPSKVPPKKKKGAKTFKSINNKGQY
jgi:hypothetical protein